MIALVLLGVVIVGSVLVWVLVRGARDPQDTVSEATRAHLFDNDHV